MIEDGPFKGAPRNHFQAILADPAWAYLGRTPKVVSDRDPRNHYPVMSLDEIKALPVADLASRDCHLFLWVTGPFLPKAFEVMQAWGFSYSATGFVWVKTNADGSPFTGLGHTTRKNAEFCLLGRRGAPKRLRKDVHEIILSQRREHSRKPDEAYERIERYCAGPYLELFARSQRQNWAAWGTLEGV